jgi:hypothetical protein
VTLILAPAAAMGSDERNIRSIRKVTFDVPCLFSSLVVNIMLLLRPRITAAYLGDPVSPLRPVKTGLGLQSEQLPLRIRAGMLRLDGSIDQESTAFTCLECCVR